MSGRVGWIRSHRKVLDNPVMCKDVATFAVWNYILLEVTYYEKDDLFGGQRIRLKPGQMVTGRKKIADLWHISESKVERILSCLESEHQIEQQKSSKNRLITVLNWEKYQSDEQQDEQQVNNERTTSEQQVNTVFKKEKKIKKEKKYIEGGVHFSENKLVQDAFNDFLEMRNKNGSKMTQKAINGLKTKLEGLSTDPITQAKILDQSTFKTWTSVYPLKDDFTPLRDYETEPTEHPELMKVEHKLTDPDYLNWFTFDIQKGDWVLNDDS